MSEECRRKFGRERYIEVVNRSTKLIDVFLHFTGFNRQNFAAHGWQTLDSRHFLTLKEKQQKAF
jgi:hypothetical protein